MKDIVLFIQTSLDATPVWGGSFDSLNEAQLHAEASSTDGVSFFIYGLRAQGQFSTVNWTDKCAATNKVRSWSVTEVDTLFQGLKNGIRLKDLAKTIGRSYAACSIYSTTHSSTGELLPRSEKARWTKMDIDYMFQARDKHVSFEEIAETLNRTPGACRVYHSRLLKGDKS